MNKDWISHFSSSFQEHGLTLDDVKYPITLSPIESEDDRISFSVYCRKPYDKQVKFIEIRLADIKVKSTVEETVEYVEDTINREYYE